ncbi:hypothetical protein [Streptosporangium sp. KLBMP 9127]|nr:hypothetical protein [Streptosporangium sp. KLBMP 9127]
MTNKADRPSNDDSGNPPGGEPGAEHDDPVAAGSSKALAPSEADPVDPVGAERSDADQSDADQSDADQSGEGWSGENKEVAELVGKLAERGDMDRTEQRKLLRRLMSSLAAGARKAGASGVGRGRWLADVYMAVAPRVPIRDLATLQEHHYGLYGEALADDLVRTAAKATMAVGAVGGALAAAEFGAPPLLLSAPAQLVAETLVVAAIETKLIAELHEVYGIQVPGSGGQRAMAFAVAWSKQRGVDPLAPSSVTLALGAAAKTALRNRLMRTLGRHLTTLGPFLTGAVAGGTLNRLATRRMAAAVRVDLRRHHALPPGS